MMTDRKQDVTNPGEPGNMAVPSLSLPKGGGALRGMDEKFTTNPVTGTGSLAIPIPISPGRSGFEPKLVLNYDSGQGNGPFGFGWKLSIPAITRKTDRGLPRYNDVEDSDTFMMAEGDDLVPVLIEQAGVWVPELVPDREVGGKTYCIRRFRPRIEGLFARIERWTQRDHNEDVHWRVYSKENILTIYGKDQNSRIYDRENPGHIFSWLISESRDDRGNGIVYQYLAEDARGVDLGAAHERHRGSQADTRRQHQRYLKSILYGNTHTLLNGTGKRPVFLSETQYQNAGWLFQILLDYGEHHPLNPKPGDTGAWHCRKDAFSSYRAGFEVRTYRLCQRVLVFHHFPAEPGIGMDCLVRSTEFTYDYEQEGETEASGIYSFLKAITQKGYRREGGGYRVEVLPAVEFDYSQPRIRSEVVEVTPENLENLPGNIYGQNYQWLDLYGEGIPGLLTEQGQGWFYKRNYTALHGDEVRLSALESVAQKPNLVLQNQQARFVDLAGDGQPDLVVFDGPMAGFYERGEVENWDLYRPFVSRLNRESTNSFTRFIDLSGNGRFDLLILQEEGLYWHPSLGEAGFAAGRQVSYPDQKEHGPYLLHADATQGLFLADLSGDGLTDLLFIRNGAVFYWPNLGYGRFGHRIEMDHAPLFDDPEQFDPSRLRLADIDGSGTTDLIYLHRDGVRLYFNLSGNGWSSAHNLETFPKIDDGVGIQSADLLGNSTACLVWSSALVGDTARTLRYVSLMGGEKPHLLVKITNNLGAETRVHYKPSTHFYLADLFAGQPWRTRLPFPVHVVEKVETYDYVSRNRFASQYAYHHGYYDGEEREFRGFGMVEQWDTGQWSLLSGREPWEPPLNENEATDVPPVWTKTWFHTGAYPLVDRRAEYFREPGLSPEESSALLLPDTVLPFGLSPKEEREACRALKGSLLRQEVYALDHTPKEGIPYTVTEQNMGVRCLQPRGGNPFAVFFSHVSATLTFHYERNATDPRVQHVVNLGVDDFGQIITSIAIAYGRRLNSTDPTLGLADHLKQRQIHLTATHHTYTNPVLTLLDGYRVPGVAQVSTYEVRRAQQELNPPGRTELFTPEVLTTLLAQVETGFYDVPYEDREFLSAQPRVESNEVEAEKYFRRLIECVRTYYRPDDFGLSQNNELALLPFTVLESLALPGVSYTLAFTPGLLASVFRREGEVLIDNPAALLGTTGNAGGGYVDLEHNQHWWIPSGRVFFSPQGSTSPAAESNYARQHFFLPLRYRDAFAPDGSGTEHVVVYDSYDLLIQETRDALDNRVSAGERDNQGTLTQNGLDYRVLQPALLMDVNRNRTAVVYNALGLVVATAWMGKPEENQGDTLAGIVPEIAPADLEAFFLASDPHTHAGSLLQGATVRVVYDFTRFARSKQLHPAEPGLWQPVYSATLSRETHVSEILPPWGLKIQLSFSYSDGFGRQIQQKVQAEPGVVDKGGGVTVNTAPRVRWVASGWQIFNNKGKPVREFQPFFSDSHDFEFGRQVGVSPILFYDPLERVVATLFPDKTYEKVVFDAWQQQTYDGNDTVSPRDTESGDPRSDTHIGGYVARYFLTQNPMWQTWYQQRLGGELGLEEQLAAQKAAAHANTPTTLHLDALGRVFLTVTHNRLTCPNHEFNGMENLASTRLDLDIEGNIRAVRDNLDRLVMEYEYPMAGPEEPEEGQQETHWLSQASMDGGKRWILKDCTGKPLRVWNSRGHTISTVYDSLRRPVKTLVSGLEPLNPAKIMVTERFLYGELHPQAQALNLRGRLFMHLEQAGAVIYNAFDFKGNPLTQTRRLCGGVFYRQEMDWTQVDGVFTQWSSPGSLHLATLETTLAPYLEVGGYKSTTLYDGLNRRVLHTTPHRAGMVPSQIRTIYNEAGFVERVEVNLRGEVSEGKPVWSSFVSGVEYDARGLRVAIEYGNGAVTRYVYDLQTMRLVRVRTLRSAARFPGDCEEPAPAGWPGSGLQDIHYTYDPVGNILSIRDAAQQAVFFRNQRVEASAGYTYDALYRLVEATGREHLGQGGVSSPHNTSDVARLRLLSSDGAGRFGPNDGQAVGRYWERYLYDTIGNILNMSHSRTGTGLPSWRRDYYYEEPSLLEPGRTGNRLSDTEMANQDPDAEFYGYDVMGNINRMPHLGGLWPAANLNWNYMERLTRVDLGGGGVAYYSYDAAGERVRKVWEKPGVVEERLYLGGFEIYRRRQGGQVLERETLHIMNETQRVALVETRTLDSGGVDQAPAQMVRFQLGNHLGSALLELDGEGDIISYEEYSPYGSTVYQAVRGQWEVPKRYRFTGKERDEESGLYYMGARYYAPWLARWTSCDPEGLVDGPNLYGYCSNRPINLIDTDGRAPRDHQARKSTEHKKPPAPKPKPKPGKAKPGKSKPVRVEDNRSGPPTAKPKPPAPTAQKPSASKQSSTVTPAPSPTYRIEILVGGPYTRGGEEHRYGHAALRIVTPTSDTVYDFGRYGRTWGTFNSQGEGILNVWSRFSDYIAGENATGRTTTQFSFTVTQSQAEAMQRYFATQLAGRTPILTRGSMNRYRLASDYDALSFNCTTITLSAVERGFSGFQSAAAPFNTGRGMNWGERQAARVSGWPSTLFMPADLQAYLSSPAFSALLSTWSVTAPTVTTHRRP